MNRIGIGGTRAFLATVALCVAGLMTACGHDGDDDDDVAQATTPWPGGMLTPGEASYGTALDRQVSVMMSDGVILKADVSYPTDLATGARATGKFPVLLTQTPYVFMDPKAGDYFVQRGYVYITAYVRGTTTSGGSFSFFADRDAKDGAELVEWAASQVQNSNGIVGLHGGSYMGLTQMYTVAALGAGSPVKAMAASCMGAEFYNETYFASGIPTQTLNFQRVIGGAMGGDTAAAGAANVVDIEAGGDKAYFRTFWQERTVGNLVQKVVDADVPTLLWSTNGDIYAQSSLELYAYLQNAYARKPVYGPMQRGTPASGRYQVIISQGGHCENQDERIQLEWFDTWLKGVKTGMEETGMPIHVHELISDRWLNTSHFPVVPAYTKYYLDNAGALSTAAPTVDGQETIAWAQPSPSTTVQYDSPVLTTGGTLAGPVSASVFASSTTNNLELIATLQLVGTDGTIETLTSGTILGSMSENDTERSWVDTNGTPVRPYGKYDQDRYTPAGTIKKYDFSISPRFVHIPPGSKLRLVFTTQTPADKCTPVLGTDPCFPTAPQAASLAGSMVTIYHGGSNASSLNLPLLKASCWRSSDNPSVPYWNVDPVVLDANAPCQE
jgi:predicted acyl esterase